MCVNERLGRRWFEAQERHLKGQRFHGPGGARRLSSVKRAGGGGGSQADRDASSSVSAREGVTVPRNLSTLDERQLSQDSR